MTQLVINSGARSTMRSSASGGSPSSEAPLSSQQSDRMGNRSLPSRSDVKSGFHASGRSLMACRKPSAQSQMVLRS